MISRWLLLVTFLIWAGPALAQADLPDAGLPDAAVGGTGAERASEEEEDSTKNPCLSDRDCDRGFACVDRTCKWRRYRDATYEGCSAAPVSVLLGAGLFLFARRRHFFAKRTK
ncbi:MAG: hypothetical protein ACOZQL_07740 [Myxococcota bacterium]